jgi:hypothetical protein
MLKLTYCPDMSEVSSLWKFIGKIGIETQIGISTSKLGITSDFQNCVMKSVHPPQRTKRTNQ